MFSVELQGAIATTRGAGVRAEDFDLPVDLDSDEATTVADRALERAFAAADLDA